MGAVAVDTALAGRLQRSAALHERAAKQMQDAQAMPQCTRKRVIPLSAFADWEARQEFERAVLRCLLSIRDR